MGKRSSQTVVMILVAVMLVGCASSDPMSLRMQYVVPATMSDLELRGQWTQCDEWAAKQSSAGLNAASITTGILSLLVWPLAPVSIALGIASGTEKADNRNECLAKHGLVERKSVAPGVAPEVAPPAIVSEQVAK